MERPVKETVHEWWSLAGGFFRTKVGLIWLCCTLGMCLVHTLLNLYTAELTRVYLNALTSKQREAFYSAVVRFALYLAFCVPFYALYDVVFKFFHVSWRTWMTQRLLDRYVALHYPLSVLAEREMLIENVESRIVDDVGVIAEQSALLLDSLVGKVLAVIGFAYMLWSINSTLCFVLVLYTIASSLLSSRYFGRTLTLLQRLKQDLISRLRFALISLRSQSEAIAFFRAEAEERSVLEQRYADLEKLEKKLAVETGKFSVVQYFYTWSSSLVPPIIMAPQFFDGNIEYGMIAQAGKAFRECFEAFSIILQNLSQLVSLCAAIHRVSDLVAAMQQVEEAQANSKTQSIRFIHQTQALRAENLCIDLPFSSKQKRILSSVSFEFPYPGLGIDRSRQRGLLIAGHSGIGKTSILRVFCKLWRSGTGTVHCPPHENSLFLTQRLFVSPLLNTIRQLLLYSLPGPLPDNAFLKQSLQRANLEKYQDDLDTQKEWHALLSPGETQRLAFARMLIWVWQNRGRELWVFLDEATSALDVDNEKRMYELLAAQEGVRYVSVGHRDIRRYHQLKLTVLSQDNIQLEPLINEEIPKAPA